MQPNNTVRWKGAALAGLVTLGASLILRAEPGTKPATPANDAQAKKVTDALVQALRDKISSPNDSLKLAVQPAARAGEGYFAQIDIVGQPVQIKKLRLSEFALHARNVRVDVGHLFAEHKVRTLASDSTLRAVVTEDDLTALLAKGKRTASMGLKVKYLGDQLQVAGNWNWGLFNGPIVAVGKLRLGPDNTVYADVLSLKLNGSEVPEYLKTKFSEKINPILDYDDVPFRPRFKGLKMAGPKAILTS